MSSPVPARARRRNFSPGAGQLSESSRVEPVRRGAYAMDRPERLIVGRERALAREAAPKSSALIVDGDRAVRAALRRMLPVDSLQVFEARDAIDALAKIDAHPDAFHVVVLDLTDRRSSALEVAWRLRRSPVSGHLPLVAFTSRPLDEAEVRRAVEHGVSDFVELPTSPAVLGAKLRSSGEQARLIRLLRDELRSAQRNATLDELTGLGNRRGLEARVLEESAYAKRHREPFALLLLDLDRFKAINDRFGHEEGDRVLVHFADALRAVSRGEDVAFRFGGDEFVLLLRACDAARAMEVGARLRSYLRAHRSSIAAVDRRRSHSAAASLRRRQRGVRRSRSLLAGRRRALSGEEHREVPRVLLGARGALRVMGVRGRAFRAACVNPSTTGEVAYVERVARPWKRAGRWLMAAGAPASLSLRADVASMAPAPISIARRCGGDGQRRLRRWGNLPATEAAPPRRLRVAPEDGGPTRATGPRALVVRGRAWTIAALASPAALPVHCAATGTASPRAPTAKIAPRVLHLSGGQRPPGVRFVRAVRERVHPGRVRSLPLRLGFERAGPGRSLPRKLAGVRGRERSGGRVSNLRGVRDRQPPLQEGRPLLRALLRLRSAQRAAGRPRPPRGVAAAGVSPRGR